VIRVDVVTSCTERKKRRINPTLRLGAFPQVDLDERVDQWLDRLASADEYLSASDLYAGEHWFEFLRILQKDFRPDTEVCGWVISAGYGLIPVDAEVAPYSASFGREAIDSVRPPGAAWAESDWWAKLANWGGPSPGSARALHALNPRADTDLVLLAVSPVYLRAIEPDLIRLFESGTEVLLFSSSPTPRVKHYPDQLVRYDGRLRARIGGSQVGLNIRTLAYALREASRVTAKSMKATVTGLMNELPEAEGFARLTATDKEVRDFIRSKLAEDPDTRPTRLLRQWRTMNRACEQGRFKTLFWEVHQDLQPNQQLELA